MGSNGRHPLHPTRIDISADVRAQVIDSLNQSLASTLDLKTQVKQAHWNVKGMDFYQLHELFDELAAELEEFVDLLAERVTALGGLALGTARIAAATSTLPEYPLDILAGKDHVIALADRYAMYGKLVRDGIAQTDDLGDADTADLYTEVSRAIDKRLWFLEAHLQAGSTDAAIAVPPATTAPKAIASSSKTKTAAAKMTTPKAETPKAEAPKAEAPKAEDANPEPPKATTTKASTTKAKSTTAAKKPAAKASAAKASAAKTKTTSTRSGKSSKAK
jgi:starvation-inducible DNA-binding protein